MRRQAGRLGELRIRGRRSRSVCALPPGDSAYAVAARQYVTGILPTPRRFLTAYGTDSALPPAVFAGIQGKGPTYMYAGDSSARTKLLQKLDSVGPWPTLLVTWRGMEQPDSTTAIIRMGGHYLGGEFHGKPAPKRAMRFVYDTAGWSFARTDEEGTT